MNDRDAIRATADEHAARDWKAGRRWSCGCHACAQARSDNYEPRSTAAAMKGATTR